MLKLVSVVFGLVFCGLAGAQLLSNPVNMSCTAAYAPNDWQDGCPACCGGLSGCQTLTDVAIFCCENDGIYCGCYDADNCIENINGVISNRTVPYGTCYPLNSYNCISNLNSYTLCDSENYNLCSLPNFATCCPKTSLCQYNITSDFTWCKPEATSCDCAPEESCCNDDFTGYRCYNSTLFDCPSNPITGGNTLCPAGDLPCGFQCYDPEWYCCQVPETTWPYGSYGIYLTAGVCNK